MKNLPVVVAFVNESNVEICCVYDKFIVDNQQMTMIFDTNVQNVVVKNVVDNQSFVLSFNDFDILMKIDKNAKSSMSTFNDDDENFAIIYKCVDNSHFDLIVEIDKMPVFDQLSHDEKYPNCFE